MRSGLRRCLVALRREAHLTAMRHRLAGAANRVGSVKVPHRIDERGRIDWSPFTKGFPMRARYPIGLGENRISPAHPLAQLAQRLEIQRLADGIRQGANNPPILARFAGWKDGTARQLDASLCVDVGAVLFGVGTPWQ